MAESTPEAEADLSKIQEHIDALMEHFDTVQIFVTRFEHENDKQTVSVNLGGGSWQARYGQIVEWLVRTDERTRKEVYED